MNTETQNEKRFELFSNSTKRAAKIVKKRFLVGSSQACDLIVSANGINAIHAVIEILGDKARIYDMNSALGTFVNGEKVVAGDVSIGDKILLGTHEFEFRLFQPQDIPAAPLDILDEIAELPPKLQSTPKLPSAPRLDDLKKVEEVTKTEDGSTYVKAAVYPLAKDPKAEFSEYIFEDVETLYPIFNYDISHGAVEVIILHEGNIVSVDYVPEKDGLYSLVGHGNALNEIEFPYLGKNEKIGFVDIKGAEVFVSALPGYEMLTLADDGNSSSVEGSVILGKEDILRFSKGDIEIFVRGTDAPPKVDHAPVFRRDGGLKKILAIVLLCLVSFLGAMSAFTVDKELEKDKAPERIATILYKPKKIKVSKNKAVEKTKTAPKKNQKSPVEKKTKTPQKKVAQKPVEKTPTKQAKGSKSAKKVAKVKKAQPRKGPTNKKTTRVTPKKTSKGGSSSSRSTAKRNNTRSNTQGAVDTYKSFDFKSSLNSLMAKGGNTKSYEPSVRSGSGDPTSSSSFKGGESMQVETAKVSNEVGDFAGAASGTVDRSKGVDGIVDKKQIATAGLPYKTVVLGSMNPDDIRRLIMAHADQFRSCYQKELEVSSKSFNGVVRLDFTIGASGHVTRVSAKSDDSRMPGSVRSCVSNVLRGIKFPEPLGGGSVSVNQPINFYPKRM